MGKVTILFSEPPHHTCLMYGLKQTFEDIPQLNRRVVQVGGRSIAMDNTVAPPPMISNPAYRRCNRVTRHLVEVSYWKRSLTVEYNDTMCPPKEINTFVELLTRNYLRFRHRYTKIRIESGKVIDVATNHIFAEIEYA